MGKIVIWAVLFFLPMTVFVFSSPIALAAVTYTRTPSGTSITSPVTFTVSVDNFSDFGFNPNTNFWGVGMNDLFNPNGLMTDCVASTTLSHTFTLSIPVGDSISLILALGPIVPQNCNVDDVDDQGVTFNDDGFIILASAGAPAGGVSGGGSGFVVHQPEVQLLTNLTGRSVSGTISVSYKASDEDDNIPTQIKYGLRKEGPVQIFFGHGEWPNFYWELLADNQPATGTYLWDTKKISDGRYRLKVKALGRDGNLAEKGTEDFIIDNTPPHFTIQATPNFSRGEPIQFEIWSSEPLKLRPSLTITQFKHEPVSVKILQDFEKHQNLAFKAVYEIVKGFDGPAQISIKGEDEVGNMGAAILGDSTFAVGVKPPPPPSLEEPKDQSKAVNSKIILTGTGLNAQKVVAKLNGTREYTTTDIQNSRFQIEISLDPTFNKGWNVINVVSYDPAGSVSAPATVNIFLNTPPQINVLKIGRRLAFKGEMTLKWVASDINEQRLTYDIELSNDRGTSWRPLGNKLSKKEFSWDTAKFPDGSNYTLRVKAYDGETTSTATSNIFRISNNLPSIVLENVGDFYTSEKSRVFGGVVRSKTDLLKSLEWSSDGGATWQAIQPEDRAWDSAFEKFSFIVPFARAGSYAVLLRGQAASGRKIANAGKLKIIFDNNTPTIRPESLPQKTINAPYLKLGGSASDDFSGIAAIEYSLDDSRWYRGNIEEGIETRSARFKIDHPDKLADGLHKISIRAVDRAGNLSKANIQNLSIDATPPRIGSFTLRAFNILLFPSKSRTLEVPAGTELYLQVAIAGKPKKVELLANEKKLNVKASSSTSLWESRFNFDGQKASLRLVAEDEVGNRVEKELAAIAELGKALPAAEVNPQSLFEKFINLFK